MDYDEMIKHLEKDIQSHACSANGIGLILNGEIRFNDEPSYIYEYIVAMNYGGNKLVSLTRKDKWIRKQKLKKLKDL